MVADSYVFFSQVGNSLARELLSLTHPPVVDDAIHEFRLEPVTSSQVERCIKDVWDQSASGYDNFLFYTVLLYL